jgi:glycosyltransferase involved in cell wall biosynthesis
VINMKPTHWFVSAIGAREHYAPARALREAGLLTAFYTDLWMPHGRALLLRGPGPLRRLAGRFHPSIPAQSAISFNWHGLARAIQAEFSKRQPQEIRHELFMRQARRYAELVATHLTRNFRPELIDGLLFGFKNGSLETFRALADAGLPTIRVLDQFDAAGEHAAILAQEHRKWPNWANPPAGIDDRLSRRWRDEWDLADVIYVNSEWTKQAIVRQGVPEAKIAIGPLAFDMSIAARSKPISMPTKPLKVLWVASVNLGKGIQYLIEAARALNRAQFEFIVVGDIQIRAEGLNQAPANMRFVGHVPREEVASFYRWADLYVLPTLSDNWPMTQVEAMAYGLPVITTTSCGTPVDDGADGIIIPPANSDALKAALERLYKHRDELDRMAGAARRKAAIFTLRNYAESLVGGVNTVLSREICTTQACS